MENASAAFRSFSKCLLGITMALVIWLSAAPAAHAQTRQLHSLRPATASTLSPIKHALNGRLAAPRVLNSVVATTNRQTFPLTKPTPAPAQPKPVTSAPAPAAPKPATAWWGPKWIDINLTTQTLVAYQGNVRVFTTKISSGVAKHPTATGVFHVYVKLKSQRMRGGVGAEHYDLPNVPNVMYFYGANAIHGAYWHHNFGHPMSHGCINASLAAAQWLFNWTPVGTTVVVHR